MAPKLPTASNKGHALLWALMRCFFLLMVAWLSLTWADLDPFHHVADVLDANAQHSNETKMQIEERAGYLVHEIPCHGKRTQHERKDLLCDAVCRPFVGACRKDNSWFLSRAHHCQCSFKFIAAQNDPCTAVESAHKDENCHTLCTTMSFERGSCSINAEPECLCLVSVDSAGGWLPLDEAIERAQGKSLCSTGHCGRACPNGVTGHCISLQALADDRSTIQTCMCEVPQRVGAGDHEVLLHEANALYPPSSDPCSRRGLKENLQLDACYGICRWSNRDGRCVAIGGFVNKEVYCFCEITMDVDQHLSKFTAPKEIESGHWASGEKLPGKWLRMENGGYVDPCAAWQNQPPHGACHAECPQGTHGSCHLIHGDTNRHCFCQFEQAIRLFTLYTAWEMARDSRYSNGELD